MMNEKGKEWKYGKAEIFLVFENVPGWIDVKLFEERSNQMNKKTQKNNDEMKGFQGCWACWKSMDEEMWESYQKEECKVFK